MKSILLLLLSITSILAQAPSSPLSTEIRSIIDEYENSVRANTQKLIAATTEEEKNKFRASIPSAGPYATKMMKLVQANLDQPEGSELAGDRRGELPRRPGGAEDARLHLC